MIKRFSVLYVGHIELDNVGRDGTPADARRYPNERVVEAMAMAEDVAREMDALGYDTLCMAEDYAMADYLTGGRVVMGIGRGYQTREVESLGGPLLDTEANAAMFREQMEVMFKAVEQDSFSHQGRFYTIPAQVPFRGYQPTEVTLVPRPVNRPVEIWQAIASGKSIPFMVQHGIKGMVTMNGELITRQVFTQFREEAARLGRQLAPGEDLAWGGGLYLADSVD